MPRRIPLGTISDAVLPSPLDEASRFFGDVPGPGAYKCVDEFPLPQGGRISTEPPREKLRVELCYQPEPGQYGYTVDPMRPTPKLVPFSREKKEPRHIMEEIRRSAKIPGPGDHDTAVAADSLNPFCPDGGRCLMASKPSSYFDAAARLTEENPGPGTYGLPGALRLESKSVAVWHHQSETIDETRRLVREASGGVGDDTPGPGTYFPVEPRAVRIPSLKGKRLPHGMPKPYDYDCMPDLCRRFKAPALRSFVPLREQNSADEIFRGRPRRSASSGALGRGAPPPAEPEEEPVASSCMGPSTPGPEDSSVQWQAGGLEPRRAPRRAASEGRISRPPPLHPLAQEAAKFYPPLSRDARRRAADRLSSLPVRCGPMGAGNPLVADAMSHEYGRYCAGKMRLDAVSEDLRSATESVLEPLNVDELKRDHGAVS